MKRLHSELIAVVLLLSLTLFISSYSEFLSTAKAISQGSALPDWAASWAGVPWDVQSGETLVSANFQDGKLIVNANAQWIWRTGYIWKGGQWQSFEFSQTSQYEGWVQSSASAEIPLSSEEVLDGENYVLAYTCNQKNGRWYCGCSTSQCEAVYNDDGSFNYEKSTGYEWQLQTFDAYTATGFSQDMSKVLSPDTPAAEKVAAQESMKKKSRGLALTVASDIKGDFNNDEKVDFDDFFLFADAFGKEASAADQASALGLRNWQYYKFDLSGNGKIDFDDFFIFSDNFGKTTQQATSTVTKPVIDCNVKPSQDDKNECWIVLAATNLDKSLCTNIKDSENAQNEQNLKTICTGKIDVYNQGGLRKPTVSGITYSGGINVERPIAIKPDGKGNFYVSYFVTRNSVDASFGKYSADGKLIKSIPTSGRRNTEGGGSTGYKLLLCSSCFAIDEEGNIYATEYYGYLVIKDSGEMQDFKIKYGDDIYSLSDSSPRQIYYDAESKNFIHIYSAYKKAGQYIGDLKYFMDIIDKSGNRVKSVELDDFFPAYAAVLSDRIIVYSYTNAVRIYDKNLVLRSEWNIKNGWDEAKYGKLETASFYDIQSDGTYIYLMTREKGIFVFDMAGSVIGNFLLSSNTVASDRFPSAGMLYDINILYAAHSNHAAIDKFSVQQRASKPIVMLAKTVDSCIIYGTVKDSAGQVLPAKATVSLYDKSTKKLISQVPANELDEGFFCFEKMSSGSYYVSTSYVGYESQTKDAKVETGKKVSLDFRLRQIAVSDNEVQVVSSLRRSVVAGKVADNSGAVVNAYIIIDSIGLTDANLAPLTITRDGYTFSDGSFLIGDVPTGEIKLTVKKSGYKDYEGKYTASENFNDLPKITLQKEAVTGGGSQALTFSILKRCADLISAQGSYRCERAKDARNVWHEYITLTAVPNSISVYDGTEVSFSLNDGKYVKGKYVYKGDVKGYTDYYDYGVSAKVYPRSYAQPTSQGATAQVQTKADVKDNGVAVLKGKVLKTDVNSETCVASNNDNPEYEKLGGWCTASPVKKSECKDDKTLITYSCADLYCEKPHEMACGEEEVCKTIDGIGRCVGKGYCKDDFILVENGKERDCWDENSQCVSGKCVKFENMVWDVPTRAQVGKLKAYYPDVRESGARAIGEIKSIDAVPALIKALETDESPFVRAVALESIAKLKDERAIPATIKALESSSNSHVRENAAIALSSMQTPKQAIPVLISASLNDKDAEVRRYSVLALRDIDSPEVISAHSKVIEKEEYDEIMEVSINNLAFYKHYKELGETIARRINTKANYPYKSKTSGFGSSSISADELRESDFRRLAELINKVHDIENSVSDETRDTIVKNLDLKSVYYLLSSGGSDLYTSSFEKIYYYNLMQGNGYPVPRYPNFMDIISNEIDPKQDHTLKFILTLANYNKLKDIINRNPSFFINSIKSSLLVEDIKTLRKNGVLLVSTIKSIFNELNLQQFKPEIEEFLLNEYKKSEDRSVKKALFGYNIKLNKDEFTEKNKAEAATISNSLQEVGFLEPYVPKEWLSNGKLTAKLYFTQKGQMSRTMESFRNFFEFDLIQQKPNSVIMSVKPDSTIADGRSSGLYNGIKLEIILTEDIDDVQESVDDPNIDIIAHRGHSYCELNVFSSRVVSKEQKLIFLGGCGGFGRVAIVQETLPNSYFLSDENIGQGDVNDRVLFYIMRSIAKRSGQSKILWSEVEQDVKDSYKKINAPFPSGIVFPHHKSLLINPFINEIVGNP